jgi:ribosome maturation factor RimP
MGFVGVTTWTVIRKGERVRVDLQNASGITATDTTAISEALEEYLSDDEITVVQVDGPVLMESEMPPGLSSAMRALGDIARNRGKRFDVGPI